VSSRIDTLLAALNEPRYTGGADFSPRGTTMRALLSFAFCLLAAACATPQQRCEIQATRDLRVVNSLIAESQATLRRGYALREEQRTRFGTTICYGGTDNFGYGFCWGNDTYTRLRPVAVNLDEERAKLQTLQQKKEELEVQARAQIEACARRPS